MTLSSWKFSCRELINRTRRDLLRLFPLSNFKCAEPPPQVHPLYLKTSPDEHIVVESKTKVSDICQELSRNPEHAILVKKGKDILGVVTARDIFAKMAEGLNATKVK